MGNIHVYGTTIENTNVMHQTKMKNIHIHGTDIKIMQCIRPICIIFIYMGPICIIYIPGHH